MFTFSNINQYHSVKQIITTRLGGKSIGNFESLNLSFKVGDNSDSVKQNRAIVSDYLKIKPTDLFFPDQCHTSNIKIISQGNIPDLAETDALITSVSGIGIGVLAADCYPILFFDPVNEIIAAAHAGWRGTVKSIASKVVLQMKGNFGTKASDILVGIGPGISQQNYEVDETVISEVHAVIDNPQRFYSISVNPDKYMLDIQGLNKQLLIDSGVLASKIECMQICTFNDAENFYSARRDGFNTGRFGAVICLV